MYSNLNGGYWTSSKSEADLRSQIEAVKAQAGATQCSVEVPFYSGTSCLACSQDQQFNFDSLACGSCDGAKQYFSFNLKRCVDKQVVNAQTNPSTALNCLFEGFDNNRWMYTYYKNLVVDPNVVDCPKNAPFWDQFACVKCPDDKPYFNLQYKVCQYCFQDSIYDGGKRECIDEGGQTVLQGPVIEGLVEYKQYLKGRSKTIVSDTI